MKPSALSPSRFAAVAALYLLSGAAGLVDEVAFSKYLSLVFGATAQASSAVLVAFMGGLAAGAFVAARVAHRIERPLFAYGILEVLVGLACALAPMSFGALTQLYVAIAPSAGASWIVHGQRAALAIGIVLVPAVGMGATLPLVTRLFAGSSAGPSRLSLLYALNTVGGAIGSILSAYALVPALGLTATLRLAAATSIAVGLVAMALGRDVRVERSAPTSALDRPGLDLVLASIASGVLVFTSEVVFVHLLALVVGTSVYAFGLVLTIFLVCLSLGAAFSRRVRAVEGAVPASLVIPAIALAASIPVWDHLPAIFERVGPSVVTWGGRELVRAFVAFAALAIPVTAMGLTFPLVLQELARRVGGERSVGRLTGANTLGAIVGSLVGGFVLLPAVGSQGALVAIASGYGLAAIAVLSVGPARRGRLVVFAGAALGMAGALLAPRWDATRLTSGANVYFDREFAPGTVVWMHEDVHGGVTTVKQEGDLVVLYTNGKFQGDNGFQMTAQRAFAHVPAMFVHRFERALVIGLGTGTTLGTLTAYPFQRIDVAELSPGIVRAARTYFGALHRNALDDPRVRVMLEDGRNVLLVAPTTYDLVTIELSSIWFAGAANLYNREFYGTVAARLSSDGILQQWIQLHHTSRRVIASQLASVRSVFPHVALFVCGDQGILTASKAPLVADPDRLAALEAAPEMRAVLGEGRRLIDHMNHLVMAEEDVERFVEDTASEEGVDPSDLISTDDNLFLEYETPRNNVPDAPTIREMVQLLWSYHAANIAGHVGR